MDFVSERQQLFQRANTLPFAKLLFHRGDQSSVVDLFRSINVVFYVWKKGTKLAELGVVDFGDLDNA